MPISPSISPSPSIAAPLMPISPSPSIAAHLTPLSCPSLLLRPSLLLAHLTPLSWPSLLLRPSQLPSRLSHGAPPLSLYIVLMQSARWILNFDEDNICGNGFRMPPKNEETILALHFAPPAGDEN